MMMRDVIKSINLFKEIQGQVRSLEQFQRTMVEKAAEERSQRICIEAINLLKQDLDSLCPVAICSVMEEFPEAIGWAYVLEAEPKLKGWPAKFFQPRGDSYRYYAQAMWDSTEETVSLMGSEVILKALREGMVEHQLTSFYDCCSAGYWLEIDPEKVATVWANMCVYTPALLKTGYKIGDNTFARELFLQRVDNE